MRSWARCLSQLLPFDWLSKARVPPVLNGVLPRATHYLDEEDAGAFVIDIKSGERQMVFPPDWDPASILIIGTTLDRCSVGVSYSGYLQSHGVLFSNISFEIYHDGWNSARHGGKDVDSARVWSGCVKLATIGNCHLGPMRSGAWGQFMTEVHSRLCVEHGPQSEQFQEVVRRQQRLEPNRQLNIMQWWMAWIGLSVVTGQRGTILKFARWFSLSQRWSEIRKVYWFLWWIFCEIAALMGGTIDYEASTGLWDTAHEQKEKGGRLLNMHTYFSFEHTVLMDTFFLSTEDLATSHFARMASHKSISHHLVDLIDRQQGFWSEEAQGMLNAAVVTPDRSMFFNICPAEGLSPEADRLVRCSLTVVTCWLTRTLPLAGSYPDAASPVLIQGAEADGVKVVMTHCRFLMYLEEALLEPETLHPMFALAYGDVFWLQWPLVRLIMLLCMQDHKEGRFDRSVDVVFKALGRLPDGRLPEDCHQKVRDVQRTQRQQGVSTTAVWASCVNSGLLEAREVNATVVSPQKVAEAKWRQDCVAETKNKSRVPVHWDPDWNKIMTSRKDFPTLSPQAGLSACTTWNAIIMHFEQDRPSQIGASWWTRLYRPHTLWRASGGQVLLFLCTGKFASVTVQVPELEGGMFSLAKVFPAGAALHECQTLVEDPRDFKHIPWEGARSKGQAFAQALECHQLKGYDVLQLALMEHRALTVMEVKLALEYYAGVTKHESKVTYKALVHQLAEKVFPLEEDIEYVKSLYEMEPVPDIDPDDAPPGEGLDKETQQMMDELAQDELENVSDLRDFKSDITKAAVKRLVHKQRAERAQAKAAVVKRRRQKVEKTAKTMKNFKQGCKKLKRSLKRKLPRAREASPDKRPKPPEPTPPVEKPPDASPPVQRRKPKTGGPQGWKAVEQPNGWIRWSESAGKIDSHCRVHAGPAGRECKMDRQLKDGAVAMAFKWLSDAEGRSYEEHVMHKAVLSSADCLAEREAERDRLRSLSDTSPEAEILRLEMSARQGAGEEPMALYCRPITWA